MALRSWLRQLEECRLRVCSRYESKEAFKVRRSRQSSSEIKWKEWYSSDNGIKPQVLWWWW